MTALYGFNEKVGHISFYDSTGSRENSFQKPYSQSTGKLIDDEVRNLIHDAYQRATKILTTHQIVLEKLAETLLNQEIVYQKQLEEILGPRVFKNNYKKST